jgi:hypothetical protein
MHCLRRGVGGVAACLLLSCGGTTELRDGASGSASSAGSESLGDAADPLTLSMDVKLGAASYRYTSCRGQSGSIRSGEGLGPTIQALSIANINSDDPTCGQWSADDPGFFLSVFFRGFLERTGLPTGSFDISETDKVRVEFSAESQVELPVGQMNDDYRIYSSEVGGAVGKITSRHLDLSLADAPKSVFRVDLVNVELGVSESGRALVSFPDRVSVPNATLYYAPSPLPQ